MKVLLLHLILILIFIISKNVSLILFEPNIVNIMTWTVQQTIKYVHAPSKREVSITLIFYSLQKN